ncbi:hypothetical protein BBJ28_00000271 [Nothophytophthora sp. Chile5]|nr:hypothetical protein BBJ28_00000271 [Nothophytophthora sp. Chile5]
MAMAMIDVGANLTDPVFTGLYRGKQRHEADLSAVLARAKSYGVEKVIVTGGNLEESRSALKLAVEYSDDALPSLYSTVGVHPTRCQEFEAKGNDANEYFAELLAVCEQGQRDGKVVAIGECGLDYDRLEFCDKPTQRKYFEKQFALAEQTRLPMFLHNRNTDGDFHGKLRAVVNSVPMVAENRQRFSNGVVHSFTGTKEEMLQLVELDLYIGKRPSYQHKIRVLTAENLECVKAIPLNRLMLETGNSSLFSYSPPSSIETDVICLAASFPLDAPWCDIRATHAGYSHVKTSWPTKKAENLPPASSLYQQCHNSQVLEIVSAIRGEAQEEVAARVYENTQRVFF